MPHSIQEVIVANDLIKRAYDYAKKTHQGEKRPNGEPFFNHSLATAQILTEWNLDQETIAAGFLHDVPTASKSEAQAIEEIKKEFGEETASLVAGVTAVTKVRYRGTESNIDNLRKFILYLSQDIRVILIKFASRLNILQSLYAYPQPMQKRLALKTMDVYAPLAHQLGMYRTAGDLEDLSFPYLYPEDYKWLITNVKERFEARELYLEKFKPLHQKELAANGLSVIKME